MTRLEKKCLVASAGAHGVVALLLALAPVIWVAQHQDELTLPVLTFLPSRLVDGPSGGGGNPNARDLPAAAPAAPPQPLTLAPAQPLPPAAEAAKPESKPQRPEPRPAKPENEPAVKPRNKRGEPVVADKKNSKTDETDDDGEAKPGKRPIELSFVREKSPSNSTGSQNDRRSRADAAARAAQAAFASRLNSVLGAIGGGMSTGTSIDVPGPGGEAYANYSAFVEAFYKNAWSPPTDLADDKATVRATVVIRRDGSVVSFTITKRSRNAALDESVERLKKLKFVEKFPDGATDAQRTFNINFILHSER